MNKIAFFGVFLITFLTTQISFAAIVPVYQVTGNDYTWTDAGGGVYTVPTAAEDYANEIWERPVEDDKWSDSGSTRTSSGKYYGYADLARGAWGVGTNSDDNKDYLFVKWEVVGDFQWDGSKIEDKELEGHYYFYAETFDKLGFAIEVPSGKDLGADFGDVSGKVNIYKENSDNDVPGNGITVTEEGGNSFGDKIVNGDGRTNTSSYVTEVAILLTDLNLALNDFTDNPLDYAYIGVAVSNPSDPNTDLFANDFYGEAIGSGVEYDTLMMGTSVPIPGAIWLFGAGIISMLGFRKKFQE